MYCQVWNDERSRKCTWHNRRTHHGSWNAIISGFSLHKHNEKAPIFFSRMLEMGINNFIYAMILDTCANLTIALLGNQIHVQIINYNINQMHIIPILLSMCTQSVAACKNLIQCSRKHRSEMMLHGIP